jgi:hypothetical protein
MQKLCPFCKSEQIVHRKKMKVEINKNFTVNIPQRKGWFCKECKAVFRNPVEFVDATDYELEPSEEDLAEAKKVLAEPETAKRVQELDNPASS